MGVTLGAVVAGDVRNIATVTAYERFAGQPAGPAATVAGTRTTLVDTSPQPELSVTKTADGQTPGQALQVMRPGGQLPTGGAKQWRDLFGADSDRGPAAGVVEQVDCCLRAGNCLC